jgi:hypothetical protein
MLPLSIDLDDEVRQRHIAPLSDFNVPCCDARMNADLSSDNNQPTDKPSHTLSKWGAAAPIRNCA